MLKIERDQLSARLAAVDDLLQSLPEDDYVARLGFEAQREELTTKLVARELLQQNRAQVALYFGGDPVIGSIGIEAEFGTKIIGKFQELITNVWGGLDGTEIQQTGPIRDKDASQLHITSVVHGSFGFVLEELEGQDEPLFQSPLYQAAHHVAQYIANFAGENETKFSQMIDTLNPRVFKTMKEFFGFLHKDKATFRLVEQDRHQKFDRTAIERAWTRAQASDVLEERLEVIGKLLGVIPMRRRFELESLESGMVIEGKVGETFGRTYLERIGTQDYAGRRWRAVLHKRTVKKIGRDPFDDYTLLELHDLSE